MVNTVKYYTALGCFSKISETVPPIVSINSREYELNMAEFLLWRSLLWEITTLETIEPTYIKLLKRYGIFPGFTFEDCLNRLIQRGLVTSGADVLGMDALYNLLCNLQLHPKASSFISRLRDFFRIWLVRKVPVNIAVRLLLPDRLTYTQAAVLKIASQADLTTNDVLLNFQRQSNDTSTDEGLMYATQGHDCYDNMGTFSRFYIGQEDILCAVAELYLNHHLILEPAREVTV